ncbi:type VI secretion system, syringe needle protein [Arcobacter venerupis]|uniref:Type VI secretion system, syringe needle protein n=1 Tax=Arcobacter venerupis TaxID=1054033 RepID=A0AAE7B7V9_9BACT|nr:type VI secretion system tip protein TssI/VgrG [Arcobacter venerupis]QKF66706.1 type VI secretion system, syringe needle protein [Arcobacter venerupis]
MLTELTKNLNILKDLRSQINQDIKCRVNLLNYKNNQTFGVSDGNYSVYTLSGESKINSPYVFDLVFISDEFIYVEDIVDTDVNIILEDNIDLSVNKKIFGKIFEASEHSIVAKKYLYSIKVVSVLAYLNMTNKYEIFHDKKVSDVILTIINRYKELLNLNLEIKIDLLNEPRREYLTQYNQSDLEFIQILCEEEGYSLIIDYSSNNPYNIVLCELNEHSIVKTYSSTCSFNQKKEFKTSHLLQDFYDKDNPSTEYKSSYGMNINSSIKDNDSTKQLRTDLIKEKFRDKLNLFNESYYKDLNRYIKIDSQREYVQSNTIFGKSQELNIQDALCISLEDEKANKKVDSIILKVKYQGYFPNALDEYKQDNNENKKMQYEVEFEAIPKDISYKPPISIKKTKINSILTAIVSNTNSNTKDYANTIDVDDKGRVKVLFSFERNKTTSCYLRVSTFFAGNKYGSQFLPRVNSEVIVSFVNGDPDYPIIIGNLHNGENKNPYDLPQNKTKSFIKTYSIPQYENKLGYNEILFEDKKANEELNLRAQKDMNILVLNDKSTHVLNNSKTIIDNKKEEIVESNSKQTINKNYTQRINQNQINTVSKEKLTTVKGNYEITVKKDLNTVVKNDIKTIVENNYKLKVNGKKTTYVENDAKEKYLINLFLK